MLDFTQIPLKEYPTPFYLYDIDLLEQTLSALKSAVGNSPYKIHYALKANTNPRILHTIVGYDLGVDAVSGGEIHMAIEAGFDPKKIAFAGVGKTDEEIAYALDAGIGCFNVESVPELEVIAEIATGKGTKAPVCIRVNPDIDAHTHKYITTGTAENKFGISLDRLEKVIDLAINMPGIDLRGLHFHIGSQLTDLTPFEMLCAKVNDLVTNYESKGVKLDIINVGGGLGIDYENPDANPIPDFQAYFDVFRHNLQLRDYQTLHFELGRAIVAQCGSLISKVLYVKEGVNRRFAIIDAGMTDLIRPALYQAHHKIQNISSEATETALYDVVGPICESSDCFDTDVLLPITHRGDSLAIRSAGAYGEVMAMTYNGRRLPASVCI